MREQNKQIEQIDQEIEEEIEQNRVFKFFSKLWVIISLSILTLLFLAICIINLSGGLTIPKSYFNKLVSTVAISNAEIHLFSVKIGFNLTFVARGVDLKTENVDLKLEQFSIKKNLFTGKILSFTLSKGDITASAKENSTIQSTILTLQKNFFLNSPKGKIQKSAVFQNINLSILKEGYKNPFTMEAFSGEIFEEEGKVKIDVKFKLGSDYYALNGFVKTASRDFEVKVESKNIVFKSALKDSNEGQVSFSINNITNFLNSVTPDSVNFDLGAFDGTKNSLYFSSNFVYNDVRRSVQFSDSKIQLFDGEEENVIIQNLNNDTYKILLNIDKIQIIQNEKATKLIVHGSQVPSLQFSLLVPDITVITDVKIDNVELIGEKETNVISNILFDGRFGYGEINLTSSFKINNKLTAFFEGFIYNYETKLRKGIIRTKLEGEKVNLTNIDLGRLGVFKYNGGDAEDFKSSFDFIISDDTGIIDNIYYEDSKTKVNYGKIEFDLYLKNKSYFLNADLQNSDINRIKITIPESYKSQNPDLFRSLFNHLQQKDFSYIDFKCHSCTIGDSDYEIFFKSSILGGKFEINHLSVVNQNIDFDSNFLLDIRNTQNSLVKFNFNVSKWHDFEFEKFLNITDIFDGLNEFRMPSFDSFSGNFNFSLRDMKGKFNTLDKLDLSLGLTFGSVKEASSYISVNGAERVDFMTLETLLNQPIPNFAVTVNIPNINPQGLFNEIFLTDPFNGPTGFVDIAVGARTAGILYTSLLQNLNANIVAKSSAIELNNFGLESLSQFLSNPASIFKGITNAQILDKMKVKEKFELDSKMSFQNMEFGIEKLEIKSPSSNSIFVGKLNIVPKQSFNIQMLGKSTIVGANLNSGLKGLMPLYLTNAISNQDKNIDINFDYSQINKYAEARRVLYK